MVIFVLYLAQSVAHFSLFSLALVNVSRIMSDLSDNNACISSPGKIVDDDSVAEVKVPVVDKALKSVRKTGRRQIMLWGYFKKVVHPQMIKAAV